MCGFNNKLIIYAQYILQAERLKKKTNNVSVEIPTRCSFAIEFIIPKFIEGSTFFERHTAHHQEL